MHSVARTSLRRGAQAARLARPPLRVSCWHHPRTFASRAKSSQSQSSRASEGNAGNSNAAIERSMAYFLDAQVACRNKRCRAGAPGDGIATTPDACGEDSFFVSAHILGVADGVGGWNDSGVDPGQISRSLMRNASAFVRKSKPSGEITTRDVLSYAYAKAVADEEVEAGSTTACLVRLKDVGGKPVLEYSNLGDSGFVLIRDGVVVFKSKFQCYGPAPYQLAKIPLRFKKYGAIENRPEDADSGEIAVQDGDLIVLATDGVWDNFASDLLSSPAYFPVRDVMPVVAWRWHWHGELSGLIDVITENEKHAAQNVVKAALRHNMKPDDITVIVAKVTRVASKL